VPWLFVASIRKKYCVQPARPSIVRGRLTDVSRLPAAKGPAPAPPGAGTSRFGDVL
jgi:hypothetical protein